MTRSLALGIRARLCAFYALCGALWLLRRAVWRCEAWQGRVDPWARIMEDLT